MALSDQELAQLAARWGTGAAPAPAAPSPSPVLNAGTFDVVSNEPPPPSLAPATQDALRSMVLRTADGPPPPKFGPPGPMGHAEDQSKVDYSYAKSASDSIPYQGGRAPSPAPSPSGGGAVLVPGGWQPHSRATTVQEGVRFSPETQSALEGAGAHARKAAEMQTQGELAQNAQAQRIDKLQANVFSAEQASEDMRKRVQARELAKQDAELQDAMSQVRGMKVEPGRWWASKGLAGQIGLALSMGLRDAGAALQGREGHGLDYIRSMTDQDIAVQQANIAEAHKGIADRETLYGHMLQRFRDEDQAAAAAKLASREQLAMQARAAVAGTKDPIIKANGERMLADIDKEAAVLRGKFDEAAQRKVSVSSQEAYRPDQWVGGGSPDRDAPDLDAKLMFTTPDGRKAYAASEAEAKAMREQSASTRSVAALAQEALELRKNKLSFLPGTPQHARLVQIQGQMTLEGKKADQLGVLSGNDTQLLHDKQGDVTSWKPGTDAKIRSFIEHSNQAFDRAVQNQNAAIVKPGFGHDKKGNVRRTGQLTGETYEGSQPQPSAAPGGFREGDQ